MPFHTRSIAAPFVLLLGLLVGVPTSVDAPTESSDGFRPNPRETAVALNYCRASFHRIRRNPSKRVLLEERERILDNLDLNGVGSGEVIDLYSAVLDEIGQVQIAEKERWYVKQQHRRELTHTLSSAFFGMGTQILDGKFVGALRTGAAGWWDTRSVSRQRDVNSFKIEKARHQALVDKSSKFLDTFWRLAREQRIEDRWLVRDTDLDRLETALAEPDPEVRLRVLGRMERFMECYPPYWYYVGRTQQQMGRMFAANDTYGRMADTGRGFFRKDELLATGLANRAVIQAYLRQPEAVETANAALLHADDVWQANLACASVLEHHADYVAAEDAILRNLDVDLENQRSTAQLVGLHVRTNDLAKLRRRLENPTDVAYVPAPLLALACAKLAAADGSVPDVAVRRLAQSLQAYPDSRIGPDDLVVAAASNWWLGHARMGVRVGANAHVKSERQDLETMHVARFGKVGDHRGAVLVDLKYPDGTAARVVLERSRSNGIPTSFAAMTNRVRHNGDEPFAPRQDAYVPVAIEVEGQRLLLASRTVVAKPDQDDGPPVAVPAPQ